MFILIWLLYAMYVLIALATPTPMLRQVLAGNWLITPTVLRAFLIVVGFLVCVAISWAQHIYSVTKG